MLGLPKHIKDDDVYCEYPVDADDEYVTDRGFQPTLPGESTKLSSALALFRAARILSKVLEEVFPAKASYELSLRKLSELSDELDGWSNSLPPHLRLQFAQDKPSTGTISSRSPLLSLAYHYIRALIQRPVVCSDLGSRTNSSLLTLASSCKAMVQIVQLLEERSMSFAFCLNKDETLVLSGFGALFQCLSLDPASKILRDNHKTIGAVADILDKSEAPCSAEFRRIADSYLPAKPSPTPAPAVKAQPSSKQRHRSESEATATPESSNLPSATRRQLKAIASRFTSGAMSKGSKEETLAEYRRATVHDYPHSAHAQSQPSLQPRLQEQPHVARSEPASSPANKHMQPPATTRPSAPPQTPTARPRSMSHSSRLANLDFLSFGGDMNPPPTSYSTNTNPPATPTLPVKTEPEPTDWEKLLGSLDNGQGNIYDACYGGPPVDALLETSTHDSNHSHHMNSTHSLSHLYNNPAAYSAPALNDIAWNSDLWALCQADTNTTAQSYETLASAGGAQHSNSVISFSTDEEGASSGEDFSTVGGDWNSACSSGDANDIYRGIVLPDMGNGGGLQGNETSVDSGANWYAGF